MANRPRLLLVIGTRDYHWHQVVKDALLAIGSLDIDDEDNAMELIMADEYDLIVVDSAAVKDVPLLVARIRAQRPDAAVIVASGAPDWTKARRAFHAGATDYVRRSFDPDEIVAAARDALSRRNKA